MKKYHKWASGYNPKVNIDIAVDALEKIRAKNDGELTVDLVLNAARPKKHPLNPAIFDIGQKAAAEQYYRSNANKLMRSIRIVIEKPKEQPITANAYAIVRQENSNRARGRKIGIFTKTEEALQTAGQREFIISQALKELAIFRKKYAAISEFAQIFKAMDDIAAAL